MPEAAQEKIVEVRVKKEDCSRKAAQMQITKKYCSLATGSSREAEKTKCGAFSQRLGQRKDFP
jgi:hypothetical protein